MSLGWMMIRGSGLVAFGLLALATIWGLVLSTGLLAQFTKRITFGHESLSIAALLATLVHMVALAMHDAVEFDVRALLVPGASDWRPLTVAWGVVAFYGMVIVIVSFSIRRHIGQRYWRLLHFASFGVFVGALTHGITAGTDRAHPVVFGLYVATASVVIGLTAVRLLMLLGPSPEQRTGRRRTGSRPGPPEEVPAGADA